MFLTFTSSSNYIFNFCRLSHLLKASYCGDSSEDKVKLHGHYARSKLFRYLLVTNMTVYEHKRNIHILIIYG
jgi:hypothetical protein